MDLDQVLDHRAIKRPIEFDPGPVVPDPADPAGQAFERLNADNDLLPWPQQAFLRGHAAAVGREVRQDHIARTAQ